MRLLFALAMLASLGSAAEVATWRDLLAHGKTAEALAAVDKSAATNDPEALDFLGWFYDEGRGVAVDKARAATIYRRAAEAGQKHAQWRLGVMLDTGDGVASDPAQAVAWFRKSAAQGFTNAYVSLGVMYSTGRGVPQSYAGALLAYQEAARRGAATSLPSTRSAWSICTVKASPPMRMRQSPGSSSPRPPAMSSRKATC
ncbi:tetratricopeptide repeat protein [Sphingomonas sp. RT2P30]|uniref:tetratricopeptide repeat protein n=1 Tax=Parasphingomonas halimpatiens TaxID=3096162 RepID=UPI002FCBA2FB